MERADTGTDPFRSVRSLAGGPRVGKANDVINMTPDAVEMTCPRRHFGLRIEYPWPTADQWKLSGWVGPPDMLINRSIDEQVVRYIMVHCTHSVINFFYTSHAVSPNTHVYVCPKYIF